MRYQIITIFLTGLTLWMTWGATAYGGQIEGVAFEETYRAGEATLPIQGMGLYRFMGLFKAYAGAIYYESGVRADEILGDKAKRLEVEYFQAIPGSYFSAYTRDLLESSVDARTFEVIRSSSGFFESMNRDVMRGDRYALTYIPGKGTELTLNGTLLAVVQGPEVAAALFSIWLGDDPVSDTFKAQLIGMQ